MGLHNGVADRQPPSLSGQGGLATGLSARPSRHGGTMVLLCFYVFDRHGTCLYYEEWHRKRFAPQTKYDVRPFAPPSKHRAKMSCPVFCDRARGI